MGTMPYRMQYYNTNFDYSTLSNAITASLAPFVQQIESDRQANRDRLDAMTDMAQKSYQSALSDTLAQNDFLLKHMEQQRITRNQEWQQYIEYQRQIADARQKEQAAKQLQLQLERQEREMRGVDAYTAHSEDIANVIATMDADPLAGQKMKQELFKLYPDLQYMPAEARAMLQQAETTSLKKPGRDPYTNTSLPLRELIQKFKSTAPNSMDRWHYASEISEVAPSVLSDPEIGRSMFGGDWEAIRATLANYNASAAKAHRAVLQDWYRRREKALQDASSPERAAAIVDQFDKEKADFDTRFRDPSLLKSSTVLGDAGNVMSLHKTASLTAYQQAFEDTLRNALTKATPQQQETIREHQLAVSEAIQALLPASGAAASDEVLEMLSRALKEGDITDISGWVKAASVYAKDAKTKAPAMLQALATLKNIGSLYGSNGLELDNVVPATFMATLDAAMRKSLPNAQKFMERVAHAKGIDSAESKLARHVFETVYDVPKEDSFLHNLQRTLDEAGAPRTVKELWDTSDTTQFYGDLDDFLTRAEKYSDGTTQGVWATIGHTLHDVGAGVGMIFGGQPIPQQMWELQKKTIAAAKLLETVAKTTLPSEREETARRLKPVLARIDDLLKSHSPHSLYMFGSMVDSDARAKLPGLRDTFERILGKDNPWVAGLTEEPITRSPGYVTAPVTRPLSQGTPVAATVTALQALKMSPQTQITYVDKNGTKTFGTIQDVLMNPALLSGASDLKYY